MVSPDCTPLSGRYNASACLRRDAYLHELVNLGLLFAHCAAKLRQFGLHSIQFCFEQALPNAVQGTASDQTIPPSVKHQLPAARESCWPPCAAVGVYLIAAGRTWCIRLSYAKHA